MKGRTPKDYSGVENPSKKMADLLPEVLSGLTVKRGDCAEDLFRYWEAIIGPKMAPLATAVRFQDGVLTVKVKSSTLYTLLVMHERPRLLQALQEKFSVRDLVFRVG